MSNFIHRLWLRRWLRGCVWVAAGMLATLILIHQYIDWSGARRWAAVQAMLVREGESIDFRKAAPDPLTHSPAFMAAFGLMPIRRLAIPGLRASRQIGTKML